MRHFILLFLLLSTSALKAQKSEALEGLIDKIVSSYLQDENTAGLAVGILDDNYTYEYYYGDAQRNGNPINESSLFPIASCSKIYTASILLQMVEEGIFDAFDPVTRYLPQELREKNNYISRFTPHLLASHQSGLPTKPRNFNTASRDPLNPYAHYTNSDLLDYLTTFKEGKNSSPIGTFEFSNFGYAVLGVALENASAHSYQELLDEYITQPFGLKNIFADLPNLDNVVTPHYFNGKASNNWQLGCFTPSIGIYTSLPSALGFLGQWMDVDPDGERSWRSEALFEHSETEKKNVQAGYGWFIFSKSKKSPAVFTISGKTDGSWAFYAMIPETQTGVVLFSNSKHMVDELGIEILDLLNR